MADGVAIEVFEIPCLQKGVIALLQGGIIPWKHLRSNYEDGRNFNNSSVVNQEKMNAIEEFKKLCFQQPVIWMFYSISSLQLTPFP